MGFTAGLATAVLIGGLLVAVEGSRQPSEASDQPPAPRRLEGLDAHDGTVYRDGDTYYLVGTAYGCGFLWSPNGPRTTFCGFSVYSSTDGLTWHFARRLFEPAEYEPLARTTWQELCAGQGDGCFNPRMVRRPDGIWLLAFNAPREMRRGRHAYWIMGCNGPAGPCGRGAGPPYGATFKPRLQYCIGNGDFSIVETLPGEAWMYCTREDQTLSAEQLDSWWTNGAGAGIHRLAGLTHVEAPGAALLDGGLTVLFSHPNCGYCPGTATGYAVQTPAGWRYEGALHLHSCRGQPRTVFPLDGHVWVWIDQWLPDGDQARAAVLLVPLTTVNRAPVLSCPAGTLGDSGAVSSVG